VESSAKGDLQRFEVAWEMTVVLLSRTKTLPPPGHPTAHGDDPHHFGRQASRRRITIMRGQENLWPIEGRTKAEQAVHRLNNRGEQTGAGIHYDWADH
jgi:hypothetical protein